MSELNIERPMVVSRRAANAIAALLLIIFAALLVSSVRQESQTYDESTHLYAGFEYWKHADFGVNPENPPLVKMIAAMPLLRMGEVLMASGNQAEGQTVLAKALGLARTNDPDYEWFLIDALEHPSGH